MNLLKKIGGLEIIIKKLAIVCSLFFYKSDNVIFRSDRFKEQGENRLALLCIRGTLLLDLPEGKVYHSLCLLWKKTTIMTFLVNAYPVLPGITASISGVK